MMINDILQEKYRVQKLLAESAKNMHDYFAKTHKAAEQIMNGNGATKKHPQERSRSTSTE